MQALAYNAGEFAALLRTPQKAELDLSDLPLMEVITHFCNHFKFSSPNIFRNYASLRKRIRDIQHDFQCTIMPEQVNDAFWNHFVAYCINDAGQAPSSTATYCSQLLSVLSWASRHRARISPTFDEVKHISYTTQMVSLTADEVSHIYHFDISTINCRPQHRRNLEKVRDMFVLSCCLGQRHSDMVRIDKGCFDRHFFVILQQKTGNQARVDLERMSVDARMVTTILEKYDYKAPYTADIANYDRYLHELLQHIGGSFNDEIKKEERILGVVKTTYTPKYKLVASHTARRTFATINTLRGYSQEDIRRATGHKSISAFEGYLCYND